MSDQEKITSSLKQLSIVFIAMVMGQLVMLGVFIFMIESGNAIPNPALHETFKYVAVVATISSIALGQFLYQAMIKKNQQSSPSIEERLTNFRSSSLIVLGTIEGPALFSLSIYFITAQNLYLAIFVLLLVIFFYFRPTESKFQKDFNN